MNSILITGCNRGLGLGLVKSLVKHGQAPKFIFATCRNLEKADVSTQTNLCLLEPFLLKLNTTENLRTIIYRLKRRNDLMETELNAILPVFIILYAQHLHKSTEKVFSGVHLTVLTNLIPYFFPELCSCWKFLGVDCRLV